MLSERTFLRMQAAAAKARLRNQLGALGDDLLAPLHIRPLVRRHPWLSCGGALLTAFLAAGGLRRRAARGEAAAWQWPAPVVAMLRQARRLVTSALGAGLLSGWRGLVPAHPPAPAPAPAPAPVPAAAEAASDVGSHP